MLSFSERQELLRKVTEDPTSLFYREHYGLTADTKVLRIDSEDGWHTLRPVTKDDLLAKPLSQRSFIPVSKLDHLRASSGTSGKPPLFSPRTHVRNMQYRLRHHDFRGAFLCYTVPMMPHWHERFLEESGLPPRVICYDPSAPQMSARLAKMAGVTGISLFVYHVPAAAAALKAEGVAEQIRLVEVTGEVCTQALYQYMRSTFPNAAIVQSYNSSEVEDAHIGMPCKPMDGTEPLAVYHGKETHYLELIDTGSGLPIEPTEGAEGDLLVTAYPGEPASMPLIRFRIGDTVRVVSAQCPHGTFSFTVLGRTDLDFLKVAGGVLRADEIARVLKLFPALVTDRFSLHCSEVATERGPMLSPILEVDMKGSVDTESLARSIEKELRVNPTLTWLRGVEEGRFLPLVVRALSDEGGKKHRRIILS